MAATPAARVLGVCICGLTEFQGPSVVVFAVENVACVLTPDHCLAQLVDVCMSIIPRGFRIEELVHITEKSFEGSHRICIGRTC